jgi:hypothetical protein
MMRSTSALALSGLLAFSPALAWADSMPTPAKGSAPAQQAAQQAAPQQEALAVQDAPAPESGRGDSYRKEVWIAGAVPVGVGSVLLIPGAALIGSGGE